MVTMSSGRGGEGRGGEGRVAQEDATLIHFTNSSLASPPPSVIEIFIPAATFLISATAIALMFLLIPQCWKHWGGGLLVMIYAWTCGVSLAMRIFVVADRKEKMKGRVVEVCSGESRQPPTSSTFSSSNEGGGERSRLESLKVEGAINDFPR